MDASPSFDGPLFMKSRTTMSFLIGPRTNGLFLAPYVNTGVLDRASLLARFCPKKGRFKQVFVFKWLHCPLKPLFSLVGT